jgi:uncharacterized membrane protein
MTTARSPARSSAMLEHPAGPIAIAKGLNNAGQVVGIIASPPLFETQAILWQDGKSRLLPNFPGDTQSAAHAVNDRGQIIGRSGNDHGNRLVLWDGDTITDLTSLIPESERWDWLEPIDMNDQGWIVGYGGRDGQTRAFLLQPVPEPTALAFAFTLSIASLVRPRKRGETASPAVTAQPPT